MSDEINRDNILDDFAMESPVCPETLRSYIETHPILAMELTDLYHELLMVDLSNKVGVSPAPESAAETSQQSTRAVAHALSGSNLRELAKELGMPRDFIAGFRDRKIRLGSIPGKLLIYISKLANVNLHLMINYLQESAAPTSQIAYKSNTKPQGSAQVDYDEFVTGLDLNEGEIEALKRMSVSDGSD